MLHRPSRLSAAALLCCAAAAFAQGPLTTSFTYQGQLVQSGSPATGLYDMHFRLYDSPSAGTLLGPTLCFNNIAVSNGGFNVQLDFGAQFSGQQRFLEIDVRQDNGQDCSNSAGFTLLSPRQQLTAEPYALWAKTASALSAPDGSPANAVYVDNAGNVGIGTTAPQTTLHVIAPASGEGIRITGPLSTAANLAYMSFGNSIGTPLGYVGDGSSGDNTIFLGAYQGDVTLVTSTGGRVLTATATGDLNLGTGSGDYRKFRIGGGNSDGFIYGSYPAFGDGIHMGYNYYADPSGIGHLVHSDGGTSRLTTGYGTIGLNTGNVGQAPVKRLTVEADGSTVWWGNGGQSAVGFLFADPSPSATWPQGTYPFGLPFNSAGAMQLLGPAGNVRFGVRSRYNVGTSVFPNEGEMYMSDATGTDRVNIEVSGESGATNGFIGCTQLLCSGTKNFITPDPNDPTRDLMYCCIEGPEAAIYTRGTARLVNGSAHIDLPDTFASVASKEGLTVILTPLSAESRGLACIRRSIHAVEVAELLHGDGTYEFDWEIKAVRRGYGDYQVAHPWLEHAHGDKPVDVLWQQRIADIQTRDAKFAQEDARLGARP